MPETDADPDAQTEVIPRAETGDGLAGTRELPAVIPPPEAAPTEPVTAMPADAEPGPAGAAPEEAETVVVEAVAVEPAPDETVAVEPQAETVAVEAVAVEPQPVAEPDPGPAPPPVPGDEPTAERLDREEVLRSLARSVAPGPAPVPAPPPPPVPAPVEVEAGPDLVVPLPPKRVKPPKTPRTPLADRGRAVRERWSSGLTVVVTVLLVALLVGLVRAEGGTGGPATAGLPGAAAGDRAAAPAKPEPAKPSAETIRAEASSVDPSGGSGLRRDGDVWRTQSYASATFGNLKDGVGLLLDLGTARAVTTVSLDVEGPIDVELRAGDRPAQDGGAFTEVATASGADGATELSGAKGGEHRYWLVWVTRLAPAGGGYEAVLGRPVVRGPAR